VNLLPGPASSQLAMFCAWRVAGVPGALVGGLAFIVPGLILILALSAVFLAGSPPDWIQGAGAGAGAAVAAVAVQAGIALLPASWRRADGAGRARWVVYVAAGGLSAALLGPWLVLVLLTCGAVETTIRLGSAQRDPGLHALPVLVLAAASASGLGALAWTAFKVGALSYGGGFVIIPLMQEDAVDAYGWMTDAQFLNAAALGQVTPGPVTHTVAAVGYAAAGVGGGMLAAAVAFAPSFSFILLGADRFDRLRASRVTQAFLAGAGPAAVGAILGAAVPLALALAVTWQFVLLGCAAVLLLVLRRGVVAVLLAAGTAGVLLAVAGAPLP
jgi:chromate transporter